MKLNFNATTLFCTVYVQGLGWAPEGLRVCIRVYGLPSTLRPFIAVVHLRASITPAAASAVTLSSIKPIEPCYKLNSYSSSEV